VVLRVEARSPSNGTCSAGITEALCKFVKRRPLPATQWRLGNRRDSGNDIWLFYKLSGKGVKPPSGDRCLMAAVQLERTGVAWNASGYLIMPGPCNGGQM
jgi:hypothetical protein